MNEPARPLLEIGWIAAGRFDPVDLEAVRLARSDVQETLSGLFPQFTWRLLCIRRRGAIRQIRPEPIELLQRGADERDAHRLDFTFVVIDSDLKAYYKPFALGVPSKAMNVAVLSTARIDPGFESVDEREERLQRLRNRILALALHLFGHLNDLGHADDPSSFMYDLKSVTDLDGMTEFSEWDRDELLRELGEEADLRLEESGSWHGKTGLFYLRAAWKRGVDILQTVVHTRPWLFPVRLSRLTTAALSALLVLMTTAEAWDLGMSQPPALVAGLSFIVLLSTVTFIVKKQRLLVRPHHRRLSEQRVISNISTVITVLTGMAITYGLLFVGTLLIARTVFPDSLVASWATSVQGDITARHYAVLSGFVASLGLAVGALGASFEATDYFRHITYVDEET